MSKYLSLFLPKLKVIGVITLIHLLVISGAFVGVSLYDNNQTIPVEQDLPGDMPAPLMINDTYDLLIVMDQWNLSIFDLHRRDQLIEEGINETTAMQNVEYRGEIGPFIPGVEVNLTAYSLDVQHGFSIDEVDLAIVLSRPVPGEEHGSPVNIQFQLPNSDTIMTGYCHIFCGIGHDSEEHKIDFIVGDPQSDEFVPGFGIYLSTVTLLFSILVLRVRSKIEKVEKLL